MTTGQERSIYILARRCDKAEAKAQGRAATIRRLCEEVKRLRFALNRQAVRYSEYDLGVVCHCCGRAAESRETINHHPNCPAR